MIKAARSAALSKVSRLSNERTQTEALALRHHLASATALAIRSFQSDQDALARSGVPGMAIAVVYRDEVVYLKGFGVRDTTDPQPVDPDTVFQLASLSKPIASTVVSSIVSDGLATWDDPLIKHDPGFALSDPWVTSQVTLKDMFAHRSGLPGSAGEDLEDVGYDRDAILQRLGGSGGTRQEQRDGGKDSHRSSGMGGFALL